MSVAGLPTDAYRDACYGDIQRHLKDVGAASLLAAEISGRKLGALLPQFRWTYLERPEYDLCSPTFPRHIADQFDIVGADQVLEHTEDPFLATRNLASLLAPGGRAIVTSVCMFPVHDAPADYWRFTPAGLVVLLRRAGLGIERVGWWGDRESVLMGLDWQQNNSSVESTYGPDRYARWVAAADPARPVVVWAVGRKPWLK
jgi:hypothetical protein